jgi:hypothetical protein
MLSWTEVRDAAGNTLDGDVDGDASPDHVVYLAPSEIAASETIDLTGEVPAGAP